MDYLQVLFEDISPDKKDILVALLSNTGFTGFEEEGSALKAFIKEADIDRAGLDAVSKQAAATYTVSNIEEKNWNEEWEAGFEPVGVEGAQANEPFAYIRAGFHEPDPAYLHDIIVTPKMSFGTGHHATTYLVVSQMSDIDFKNKTVIDFGTGTGILAILAEKLGASSVLAIDCDDWSINNAKENMEMNGCERISIVKAETIWAEKSVDIILANINLNIIKDNLTAVKKALKPGATVLFSGIMLHDKTGIIDAVESAELNINRISEKDGWLAIYAAN